MGNLPPISCLFVDVGGVLLSNGWGSRSRKLAAKKFAIDFTEMEKRHQLNFEIYEIGKITLKEYLRRVVFFEKRSFTGAQFRNFMFAQSTPFPRMIDLIARLKIKHNLKIAVVSNEGRELNSYRIHRFKLNKFVDFFISSCFVAVRKPDADIFQLALDISQVALDKIIYIENTAMFIDVAQDMGMRGILHTDYKSTRIKLASLGLQTDEVTHAD